MPGVYDDHGVRFLYPDDWELEVVEDGQRTTVTVNAPGGTSFFLLTIDPARPQPALVADEALAAMRSEYPELETYPAFETIARHKATGHDVEFFSLDLLAACEIRSFRSRKHTVLMLTQWAQDRDADQISELFSAMRQSFIEVDDKSQSGAGI